MFQKKRRQGPSLSALENMNLQCFMVDGAQVQPQRAGRVVTALCAEQEAADSFLRRQQLQPAHLLVPEYVWPGGDETDNLAAQTLLQCPQGIPSGLWLDDELLPEDLEWIDIVYQYSGVTFGYQEISRGNVNLPANFNEQVVKGRLYRDMPFNDHGSDLMLGYDEKGRFGLQRKVLPDAPF